MIVKYFCLSRAGSRCKLEGMGSVPFLWAQGDASRLLPEGWRGRPIPHKNRNIIPMLFFLTWTRCLEIAPPPHRGRHLAKHIVYSSQKVEPAPVSGDRRMDTNDVVHPCSGTVVSLDTRRGPSVQRNSGEP